MSRKILDHYSEKEVDDNPDDLNIRVFMLKSDKEIQVNRATERVVSIYASPLRLRKIRSTLNFSNIVGLSNPHSSASLLGGKDTNTASQVTSPSDVSSIKSGEDDYVSGIRRVLDWSIRDPRIRDETLARCSGVTSGPLSCKICCQDGNLTASQLFWQHEVNFTLPPELLEKKEKIPKGFSDYLSEGERIGFVQHLNCTKRLLPFQRYSQLCRLSCCLEDNARLFPNINRFL